MIINPVLETNSGIIIRTRTRREKTIMETNFPPALPVHYIPGIVKGQRFIGEIILECLSPYNFQIFIPGDPDKGIQSICLVKTPIKAMLMFSTKLSISAFIQYNSENHLVSSNIRFRYNPREGNDLWIVYNEGTNTDLTREIPNPPRLAGRTVMLKYTYTFRL